MKKWVYFIAVLLLALSCVGQRDDPEPGPEPGSESGLPSDIPGESGAYYRRSLVLDFTGTWCVHCPKMEAAIEDLQARRIAVVSVHCMPSDKMAVIPLSDDLAKRFGVVSYPSAVVDLDPSSLVTTPSATLLEAACKSLLEKRQEAAGIRVSSTIKDDMLEVTVEATAVREGSYSLHFVVLEDGIVEAQTGSSSSHVHNNVLRSWHDSEPFTSAAGGDCFKWSAVTPV